MDITPDPRRAVLRRLAARADHFAEQEQLLVQQGRYADAEGAHQFGMWCLRAYKIEADDPTPDTLAPDCAKCANAYAKGRA